MVHLNFGKIFYLIYFLMQSFGDTEWSPWGSWSSCSQSCGYGVRTQTRTCLHTTCTTGQSVRVFGCNRKSCHGQDDVVWAAWGLWSECSQSCGSGSRSRNRSCGSGTLTDCCSRISNGTCESEHKQTKPCVNDDCLFSGQWGDWRPWGRCSASCGDGIQTRVRFCEPHTNTCLGAGEQYRPCYVQCKIAADVIQQMDRQSQCTLDTCRNGGVCDSDGGGVLCQCQGQWRGRDCSILCLPSESGNACVGKHGLFYVCDDCNSFLVCAFDWRFLQRCIPPRIWTGDGCDLPGNKDAVCLKET